MFSALGILFRKRAFTNGRPVGANDGLGGLGGGVSIITSGCCSAQSRCCSSPSSMVVRKGVSMGDGMLTIGQSREEDCLWTVQQRTCWTDP